MGDHLSANSDHVAVAHRRARRPETRSADPSRERARPRVLSASSGCLVLVDDGARDTPTGRNFDLLLRGPGSKRGDVVVAAAARLARRLGHGATLARGVLDEGLQGLLQLRLV